MRTAGFLRKLPRLDARLRARIALPGRAETYECRRAGKRTGKAGCCRVQVHRAGIRHLLTPAPAPGDGTWSEQYCDGSYRVQHHRRSRCALTEIGIRYWEYLPCLFDWPADYDHEPCPLGETYQLARNALAATLTPDGELDPGKGHVLVVYDARNPEFQGDGRAERQWKAVIATCRVPGLVRRLSWQRLMVAVAHTADTDVSRRWCGEEIRPGTGLAIDPDRGHPSSTIPSQATSLALPGDRPFLPAVVEQHRVGWC